MAALPPQIEDLEDFTETHNVLCHGDTGAGKNRLWGRVPKLLVLAIEPGATSMKKAGIKGVKVWRCRTWQDIVKAYEWLRDNSDAFEWVMIDSITKAQALCIRDIMQKVVKANDKRDPLIPAQGDHFKWQLSIKQMVMDFNELPVNTIWLSRSMVRENPDGDDIIVPHIEGKDYGISAWVAGEMSLLCYLKKVSNSKGEVSRELYTNEHATYWCKDWYDVLPHVITYKSDVGVAQKIVDLIDGSGNSPRQAKVDDAARPPKKKVAKKAARARKA